MCPDGSGDALAELEHALDQVAEQNLKGLFGPQVVVWTKRLLRAANRLDAQVARSVREGELTQAAEHDGAKTMQSWLRGHGRLSSGAAHRLVTTGRALEHLPAVAAAFGGGRGAAAARAGVAPGAPGEPPPAAGGAAGRPGP